MNAPKMPLHHSPDYKPDAGEVSPPVAKLRAIIGERDKLRAELAKANEQNARLREALEKINEWGDEEDEWDAVERYQAVRLIARAALAKDKP